MPPLQADRWLLERARGAIDGVDDGLILMLAARRRLVRLVGAFKARAGAPGRDHGRELHVHARAQSLAERVGVPGDTARSVLDLAIADACRQQGLGAAGGVSLDADQGRMAASTSKMAVMPISSPAQSFAPHLLRWLPPPRRMAPWVGTLPDRWLQTLLEAAVTRVLAAPLRDGSLDFMEGRRLGIEVSDLGLRWVLTSHQGRLRVTTGEPEASVRGSATDLLLLAGRIEDADALFFQRALVLTGDTELGLTARNVLDRLPWESVPLGVRIALNRGARLARMAREAYQLRQGRQGG